MMGKVIENEARKQAALERVRHRFHAGFNKPLALHPEDPDAILLDVPGRLVTYVDTDSIATERSYHAYLTNEERWGHKCYRALKYGKSCPDYEPHPKGEARIREVDPGLFFVINLKGGMDMLEPTWWNNSAIAVVHSMDAARAVARLIEINRGAS